MEICFGSFLRITTPTILLFFFFTCVSFTSTDAAVRDQGIITIKWDVISWAADGYVAAVTIFNYQPRRSIKALGWTWAKREVIWSIMGGQTTEQGDCSRFIGSIPHCCKKDPEVVLGPWTQGPAKATSSFQLYVGAAGTTNTTVGLPRAFTVKAPSRDRYACGQAKIVRPTRFITQGGRRMTQAMMTWNVTCT